jgi:hypothetical protein
MSYTKIYIGDNEDLSMYMGDDIIGFTFTVTNSDDSAYDFTGYTDVYLKIYDHRGGALKATIANGATGVAISSNVITWNSDYSADIALTEVGLYYYELTYEDATSRPITVCFGDLKLI